MPTLTLRGLLPRRSAASPATATPPVAPVVALPADPDLSDAELTSLAERRAQVLRSMFPLLFSMCARRADLWRAVAIERYLSQATNTTDLEQRIHEVQRQSHFGCSV